VVFLCSGVSFAGLFGKSDKEVQEEINKRESALKASFGETIAQKDKIIAEKDAEIEKLKSENAGLSAQLEETNKKPEEVTATIEPVVVPVPVETKETRTLEEIITTEITKYAQAIPSAGGFKVIFNTDFFFYHDIPETVIYRSLDVILKALKAYPDHRIAVNGYTDSTGNEKNNSSTSLIKAKAVANYFIAKGIPPEKIAVSGLGSANAIDTNKTKEGRKQNRRVEVIIK
jgi:outer membrane protein OmpA-like peptidoglycan-associated protein